MKTPLKKIADLKNFSLREVFIKDEFAQRYGTIKDRRNCFSIDQAIKYHVDILALITSGNNGYSIAKLVQARRLDMKVIAIVDKDISKYHLALLESVCYQVIKINLAEKFLKVEEVISFARQKNNEVVWDVTNGYEGGYAAIIQEIFDDLHAFPDKLMVPLGSGGIFCGLVEEILRRNIPTKVIGVQPKNKAKSLADKLVTPWSPYEKMIERFVSLGHKVMTVDEAEIAASFEYWQDHIGCEPSSSIVFSESVVRDISSEESVVFINSGKLKI